MFISAGNTNFFRPLTGRERGRVKTIERRIAYLEKKIDSEMGKYDLLDNKNRRELSALRWAVAYIKIHNEREITNLGVNE